MLGTNELKTMYNHTSEEIAQMFEKFVTYIINFKSQVDGSSPKLIVSGIPPIPENEINLDPNDIYYKTHDKCKILQQLNKQFCEKNNITYIDNSNLEVGIDNLHLTETSHQILANKLYEIIKTL